MANDWFRFKQFTINQSASAMKVGTDAVLLGAWANFPDRGSYALDVGTGTGLLALMIAQRYSDVEISAVEIDKSSCEQARENFSNSEWGNRISLHEDSFQDFHIQVNNKFDLIITNPPYFSNSLKNPDKSKSLARHQDKLTLEELFLGVAGLLEKRGLFSLILPSDQKDKCLNIAVESGLFPQRILNVRPKPENDFIRTLMEFSFAKNKISEDELIIEMNKRHLYSEEYKALTKDFYLKF